MSKTFNMFVKVEPLSAVKAHQSGDKTSRFVATLLKNVHRMLVLGGIYPGERRRSASNWKRSISRLKKAIVGLIVIGCLVQASLFCYAVYNRTLGTQNATRLVTNFLIMCLNLDFSVVISATLPGALWELEDAMERYGNQYGLSINVFRWCKIIQFITAFLILFVVFSVPVTLYGMQNLPEFMCDLFPLCKVEEPWKNLGFSFNAFTFFATTMQWQGLYTVSVFFSLFLLQEFKGINQKFQGLATTISDLTETQFEELTNQHESLVDVLMYTNNCVCHFNLITLFFSIPINCSQIYSIITSKAAAADLMACIPFGLSIISLAGRLLIEARINTEAHGPLQYVWKLRRAIVSDKGFRNFTIFVTRLTGECIGYNIYGFLTITMPALLAIFGTFAAYFVIIVQFRPTDTSPECEIVKNITHCVN